MEMVWGTVAEIMHSVIRSITPYGRELVLSENILEPESAFYLVVVRLTVFNVNIAARIATIVECHKIVRTINDQNGKLKGSVQNSENTVYTISEIVPNRLQELCAAQDAPAATRESNTAAQVSISLLDVSGLHCSINSQNYDKYGQPQVRDWRLS